MESATTAALQSITSTKFRRYSVFEWPSFSKTGGEGVPSDKKHPRPNWFLYGCHIYWFLAEIETYSEKWSSRFVRFWNISYLNDILRKFLIYLREFALCYERHPKSVCVNTGSELRAVTPFCRRYIIKYFAAFSEEDFHAYLAESRSITQSARVIGRHFRFNAQPPTRVSGPLLQYVPHNYFGGRYHCQVNDPWNT